MTSLCWTASGLAALVAVGCSSSSSGEANRLQGGAGRQGSRPAPNPVVVIETSMGTIKAELWADKTPGTADNFLRYADEGFFDGLIFHRVMDGFMIQGGGFTSGMRPRQTHQPIRNEAGPLLRNDRGTLAMARTGDPHSATSQFFINLKNNNDALDQKVPITKGFGYCAFGRVIEGMDVVDRIAKVKCKLNEMGEVASPIEPVEIKSIRREK